MKDRRQPPFCYQETAALAVIRGRDRGKRGDLGLSYSLAVYLAMTEIANEQLTREDFRATRKEIAAISGTSTKTVDRVTAELEQDGLLDVERRDDDEPSLWTLLSPGARPASSTPAPESDAEEPPEAPKTVPAKVRQFHERLGDRLADDDEIVLDAVELLKRGEKVKSLLVTPDEMAKAAICIATFNKCFEWKRPGGKPVKGSDFGLGANLTSAVQRIRERSNWPIEKWVRLVESAWRIRWWEQNGRDKKRRPTPQVIFSPRSFENVVQDARDEHEGQSPTQIVKRRYTRG